MMDSKRLPTSIVVGLATPPTLPVKVAGLAPGDLALLQHALWLAARTSGEVTFVTVLDAPDDRVPGTELRFHDVLRRELEPFYSEVVELASAAGVRASYVVRRGIPAMEVLAVVRERSADLLMVRPRRHAISLVDRMRSGSTTERVLRKCPCPVWVVHPAVDPSPKRIAVPVDFSAVSRRCLDVALTLSELTGATVQAVHAMEYANEPYLRRLPNGAEAVAAYRAQVHEAARERLTVLLGADAERVDVVLVDGWIVEALAAVVSENQIDLVVMGSVARTGVSGFIVGNTAEKLFRTLDAPLWVIKPEGWDDASAA